MAPITLEQLLLPERSGRIDFLKERTGAKSARIPSWQKE